MGAFTTLLALRINENSLCWRLVFSNQLCIVVPCVDLIKVNWTELVNIDVKHLMKFSSIENKASL